ncbi:hypothetical protein D3C78_1474950 [compost metagenome]
MSLNEVYVGYNLLYEEEMYITKRLNVTSNIVEITNALSYAQNTVRLSDAQYNQIPVVANNIVNSGFTDGLRISGPTSLRPTVGLYVGLVYFDSTINKGITWNGTVWKDGTGTNV